MKKLFKYLAISVLVAVLSLPLWAQMVVPTIPAGGGAGVSNPSSIAGLYCLLTGCTIDPGPFVVNGEFEVNNSLISACGGVGPCTAGPAFLDRVGIHTNAPITDLDVNGSVNIGTSFATFDHIATTAGINTSAGTDATIPLQIGGAIQVQSSATVCGPAQKGALQSDVSGNFQSCNQDEWWTINSGGPNSFPVAATSAMEMTGGNLECNGSFGDCVDGDEVESLRAQGTSVGTCSKVIAGTGMKFRSPCASSSVTSRKLLGGRDCVEFEGNRTADFFACSSPWGPSSSYSACFVGQPFRQGDMKDAAAINFCGNGGTANLECGFYFAKSGYDMQIQTADFSLNANLIQNLNTAPIAGELIVSCYSVTDVGGVNPSGILARSGGLRGAAGFDQNPTGTARQPRTWNVGGAGTGATGTQPLFQGYILGIYGWINTALTEDELDETVDKLLLQYRSYN
jgi:hypothetical protein